MEFKANRVDEANVEIKATISKELIEKNLDKVAAQAAKIQVDPFVPSDKIAKEMATEVE